MTLSKKQIQDFVNATNDQKKEKTDTYVYGTIYKSVEGEVLVRLDGSATFTPVSYGVEVENQDRVMVLIKDHSAVVMANYTSRSATTGYVGNIIDGVYTNVSNAMNGVGSAQISANNKNRVFYLDGQNGEDGTPTVWPTGSDKQPLIENDIWFNTGEGYCIYNWNGVKWVRRAMEHQAIASIDIGKATVGILSAANIDVNTLRGKRLESNDIIGAYIRGGIIDVGGINDISGSINLYNSDGGKFGLVNRNGILLKSSTGNINYIRIEDGGLDDVKSTKGVGIGNNFFDVWSNDSSGKLKTKAIMTNLNGISYIGLADSNNNLTTYISDDGNIFEHETTFEDQVFFNGQLILDKNISMSALTGIRVGLSYILQQTGSNDVSVNAINVNTGILKLGHEGTKNISAGVPFSKISVDASLEMHNNCYLTFTNASGVSTWQVGLSLYDNAHVFSQENYYGSLSIGHQNTASTQISGKSGTVFLGESSHSYFRVPAVANNTTTSAANVNVASNGVIRLTTSTKRDKLMVEDLDAPFDNVLNISPKTWHDRCNAEHYAEVLTRLHNGELTEEEANNACVEDINRRTEGVLAEDFIENGLGIFCDLDDDGEVIGFHGSIAWITLLPVVKKLKERVEALELEIQNGKDVV